MNDETIRLILQIVSAIMTAFVAWQSSRIHTSVNSTATKLAEDKTAQGEVIKNLINENAKMAAEAHAQVTAQALERSNATTRRSKR